MSATSSKVDWLSWTSTYDGIVRPPLKRAGELVEWTRKFCGIQLEPGIGKGRSWQTYRLDGPGIVVFFGNEGPATWELTGKGCDWYREHGDLRQLVDDILNDSNMKISRFDHATDMVTDTMPTKFAKKRSNKRHKSFEIGVSTSGETVYIGSRKSDRFARVYRYFEPHPRHKLLRVEHVFKGKSAELAARQWLDTNDESEFAAMCGNGYGWEHKAWTPTSAEKVQTLTPDRGRAKTVRWLYTAVAPAVARLVTEGTLTREEALAAVLSELDCHHGEKYAHSADEP